MWWLLACLTLPLLVLAYDLISCLSFYRETNARAARTVALPERPRSIAPDQVTLKHALLFLVQKENYWLQLVTTWPRLVWLYLRPVPTTDTTIAELIANTSLMTWISTAPLDGGGLRMTLKIDDFAFPLFPDRFDTRLVVVQELLPRTGDGTRPSTEPPLTARTLQFKLNGIPIDSRDEQLSILAMMISSVTHPVIHSFNNRVYQSHSDSRLEKLEDLFLHGQYLNWCAWFFPGILFRIGPRGHHWYRKVLAHNALLVVPDHTNESLAGLAPYSRSLRFMLAGRSILSGLHEKYALTVDLEALYICTIIHSIDHVSCYEYTRGHLLRNVQLSNRGFFNFIALLFYRPAQHFWTNLLRDKRNKTPLYRELYDQLRAVDAALADQVTLSISY